MEQRIIVTNTAGELLGWIVKTQGGFYRTIIAIGMSVGPFFSVPAARQHIWASFNPNEKPVETFPEYCIRNQPNLPNMRRETIA